MLTAIGIGCLVLALLMYRSPRPIMVWLYLGLALQALALAHVRSLWVSTLLVLTGGVLAFIPLWRDRARSKESLQESGLPNRGEHGDA